MCSAFDFFSTVTLAVVCLTAVPLAVLHDRFLRRLETTHPSLWEELGARKVWFRDGDKAYAAAQLFLLGGEYQSLSDAALVKLGDRARLAGLVFGLSLFVWTILQNVTHGTPQLSCLWR